MKDLIKKMKSSNRTFVGGNVLGKKVEEKEDKNDEEGNKQGKKKVKV